MSPTLLRELQRRIRADRELSRNAAAEAERALANLALIGPKRGAELRRMVYG